MNNILVTGGLGFIGSNFIRMLLNSGDFDQVINFDKQTYAGNPDNLLDIKDDKSYHFIHGDICDGDAVLKAIKEYEIDAVVNFAA